MRASHESLVRQLTNAGYFVDTFAVVSEGSYASADADWNYKDVPHLNVVHTQVRAIVGTLDEQLITTLNVQRILGIPFPVTVVNYASGPDSQTYFTTLGPFVLVVYTRYEALEPQRTRVTTTYHVASDRFFALFFPLVRRVLKRNYQTLMSEDLPMRERRGALRTAGFSFRSDGRTRTFSETTDLRVRNVVAPERAGTKDVIIALADLATAGSEVVVGMDDDRGVRVVRSGTALEIYPRVCDHEGASLDCSAVRASRVRCPWHGKVIPPMMRVEIAEGAHAESGTTTARIDGDRLRLSVPSDAPADRIPVARAAAASDT